VRVWGTGEGGEGEGKRTGRRKALEEGEQGGGEEIM